MSISGGQVGGPAGLVPRRPVAAEPSTSNLFDPVHVVRTEFQPLWIRDFRVTESSGGPHTMIRVTGNIPIVRPLTAIRNNVGERAGDGFRVRVKHQLDVASFAERPLIEDRFEAVHFEPFLVTGSIYTPHREAAISAVKRKPPKPADWLDVAVESREVNYQIPVLRFAGLPDSWNDQIEKQQKLRWLEFFRNEGKSLGERELKGRIDAFASELTEEVFAKVKAETFVVDPGVEIPKGGYVEVEERPLMANPNRAVSAVGYFSETPPWSLPPRYVGDFREPLNDAVEFPQADGDEREPLHFPELEPSPETLQDPQENGRGLWATAAGAGQNEGVEQGELREETLKKAREGVKKLEEMIAAMEGEGASQEQIGAAIEVLGEVSARLGLIGLKGLQSLKRDIHFAMDLLQRTRDGMQPGNTIRDGGEAGDLFGLAITTQTQLEGLELPTAAETATALAKIKEAEVKLIEAIHDFYRILLDLRHILEIKSEPSIEDLKRIQENLAPVLEVVIRGGITGMVDTNYIAARPILDLLSSIRLAVTMLSTDLEVLIELLGRREMGDIDLAEEREVYDAIAQLQRLVHSEAHPIASREVTMPRGMWELIRGFLDYLATVAKPPVLETRDTVAFYSAPDADPTWIDQALQRPYLYLMGIEIEPIEIEGERVGVKLRFHPTPISGPDGTSIDPQTIQAEDPLDPVNITALREDADRLLRNAEDAAQEADGLYEDARFKQLEEAEERFEEAARRYKLVAMRYGELAQRSSGADVSNYNRLAVRNEREARDANIRAKDMERAKKPFFK